MRQRKGINLADASRLVHDPNVFGSLMVKMGDADAFISGLTSDYPDSDPALPLQIHHTARGVAKTAGVYIMIVEDQVYLFTDATVNIEPTAEDLAEIACLAADFAKQLEIEPRVAFLSFSNFGSTPHPLSDKVRQAVALTKSRRPDLQVDGEMQADTAVVADIIEESLPVQFGERRECTGLPVTRIGEHCLQAAGTFGKGEGNRSHPAWYGCTRPCAADR